MPTNSPNGPLYKCVFNPGSCHVTDLTAAEFRCYSCKRLQPVRSDGKEPVTVIHVHLRESLAEAERKLADAERRIGLEHEAVLRSTGIILAGRRKNATLTRQIETAREAIKAPVVATCDPTDPHVCHHCHQLREFCKCAPVSIVTYCPKCRLQHIDVDDDTGKWATTRHHRKHLCKPEDGGCGNVWQPFDYPTVGVPALPQSEPFTASSGSINTLPSSDLCGFTFYATVPPGIRKPMSRCTNPKPCWLSGHSAKPCPDCSQDFWFAVIERHPSAPMDRGAMLGWFANAIMAGYDEARRRYDPEAKLPAPDPAEPFSAEEAREEARRQDDLAAFVGGLSNADNSVYLRTAATLYRYADLTDTINSAAIECAVGGLYRIPDGRAEFWIDVPAARKIASRVLAVLAKRRGNEGGGE